MSTPIKNPHIVRVFYCLWVNARQLEIISSTYTNGEM